MLSPLEAELPVSPQTDATAKPAYPASMQTFQIPSHGALLNAFVYVATGPGPHPALVLLHGFPGNERNLDLAQDIRRAWMGCSLFQLSRLLGLSRRLLVLPSHRRHGGGNGLFAPA